MLLGDARRIPLKNETVQCVVTSPPYWAQRRYGMNGEIGLEPTPEKYIAALVELFRDVRRVLRDDGTLWLVLGDSYSHAGRGHRDPDRWPKQNGNAHFPGRVKERSGAKPKDLLGLPWRVALALQSDGWWLRSAVVWEKPTAFPEAVTDRPSRSYENIFLLSKNGDRSILWRATDTREWSCSPDLSEGKRRNGRWIPRWRGFDYYYDADAVMEPVSLASVTGIYLSRKASAAGITLKRNKRDVWTIASERRRHGHFAAFPQKLVEPCILAGSRPGDLILDPFIGSGTTGIVAEQLGRRWVGVDLNWEYVQDVQRETRTRNQAQIEGTLPREVLQTHRACSTPGRE